MKYPKFIIEGNDLVIGKAVFHKNLAIDKDNVISGGWYLIYPDEKIIHLYNESIDFGRATEEEILNCLENGNVGTRHGVNNLGDYTIYHSLSISSDKKKLSPKD